MVFKSLLAAGGGIVLAAASSASAVDVVFNDFSSTAGLTLNGSAAVATTSDGKVLRITPALGNQSGSFFSNASLNASDFSTSFQFRITNPGGIFDGTDTGADGIVFVIQPISSSIGGGGGGIGYQGINPSVGVEFDTWHNSWDPDSNHAGVDTNGSVVSLQTVHVDPRFDDGNLWTAWIDYNGTTLELRANQTGVRPAAPLLSRDIDIATIIGQDTAFVGFTSGTGGAFGNHDIVSWEYRDQFNPIGGGGGGGNGIPEPLSAGLLGLAGWTLTAYTLSRRGKANA